MSLSNIWIGMDVHKDTVMLAVYKDAAQEPGIIQQLPNDHRGPARMNVFVVV